MMLCDLESEIWADFRDFLHWLHELTLLFNFIINKAQSEKYAVQSQLECKLTIIVFQAEANTRQHFSQCSDLLIMNGKLLSLLFIKWLVTADERLVSEMNGICHRASRGGRHWKSEQQTDRQTWASVTEQKVGLSLATLSHSEEYVLYTVSSLHVSIRAFEYMEGEKPFNLTGSSSLSQQWC